MEAKHRETQEGLEEGAALLRRSLAIDPTFARAWTGLFWALYGHSGYVDETPEARKEREDMARRAVELDCRFRSKPARFSETKPAAVPE